MIEGLFWGSIAFMLYAYAGYPILLALLATTRARPVRKAECRPSVSAIITVHNEEKRLGDKIENMLRQDYPREKLEILIASDGSSDGTNRIALSYTAAGVTLVEVSERKGKEHAQKVAIGRASGEILVFSDVATLLDPDGISNIVKNFHDPTVGCVSSADVVIDARGRAAGEGVYVRYEMWLRRLESRLNTVVSLSGSFFAARREVCQDWACDLQSDFNTLLNTVKMGLRGILDDDSRGYYRKIVDEQKEFDRKVRTVVRGISVLMSNLVMLNPFKYGLFSWQLLSHKLCRWLVPIAMILALVTNAVLIQESKFYGYGLAAQVSFYGVGFAGIRNKFLANVRFLTIPSFFVLANWSVLSAWYRYARGQRITHWNPSER